MDFQCTDAIHRVSHNILLNYMLDAINRVSTGTGIQTIQFTPQNFHP